MAEFLKIESHGYEGRLLGIWRGHTHGKAEPGYNRAMRAASHASLYARNIDALANNADLTAVGKLPKAREQTVNTISALRSLVDENIRSLKAARADRLKLLAVPPADQAGTLIDLEIARYIRGMSVQERQGLLVGVKLGEASDRIMDAVLRLPRELTGLSREQVDAIAERAAEIRCPGPWTDANDAVQSLENASEVIAESIKFAAGVAPVNREGTVPRFQGVMDGAEAVALRRLVNGLMDAERVAQMADEANDAESPSDKLAANPALDALRRLQDEETAAIE